MRGLSEIGNGTVTVKPVEVSLTTLRGTSSAGMTRSSSDGIGVSGTMQRRAVWTSVVGV